MERVRSGAEYESHRRQANRRVLTVQAEGHRDSSEVELRPPLTITITAAESP